MSDKQKLKYISEWINLQKQAGIKDYDLAKFLGISNTSVSRFKLNQYYILTRMGEKVFEIIKKAENDGKKIKPTISIKDDPTPENPKRWNEAQINALHNFVNNHSELIEAIRKDTASLEDYTKAKIDLIRGITNDHRNKINDITTRLNGQSMQIDVIKSKIDEFISDITNTNLKLIELKQMIQFNPRVGWLRRLWRWLW